MNKFSLKTPSVALKAKQLLPTPILPKTIILKFKSYLAFLSFIISILSSFFFFFGGLFGSNGVKYPESSPSDFSSSSSFLNLSSSSFLSLSSSSFFILSSSSFLSLSSSSK